MNLYQLTDAYRMLLDQDQEGEGGGFMQALLELSDGIDEKVESLAKVVRTLEAEAEAYRVEATRLADQAAVRKTKVVHIKNYLAATLQAVGKDTVKGKLLTVALQDSPPSLAVTDVALVPPEFFVVVPESRRVDARAVIANWKQTGVTMPGTAVTVGKHIRIR